jgi:prophage antirepressor-like protein
MNTVIDILSNKLKYGNTHTNFVIDNNNNIWFRFLDIVKILGHKSPKDALRNLISKKDKKV